MVVKDEFQNSTGLKTLSDVEQSNCANPYDRLAAAIVDGIIILLPFITLIVAPFKYTIATGYLYKNYEQVISSAFKMSLLGLLVTICYFTIFHALTGQTPGKKFFELRVVNIWTDKKPSYYQSFIRSLMLLVCVLIAGIPFLSLFSDRLRRAIHDKVSDTMVVGDSDVTKPNILERSFVRGVFTSFLILFVFVCISTLDNMGGHILNSGVFSDGEINYSDTCKVIEDSKNKVRNKNQPVHNKEIALALFAAGALNRECLERELYLGTSAAPTAALDLLINSFIYSDIAELSNKYLDAVCSKFPKSVECDVTNIISLWSESKGKIVDLNRLMALASDSYPDYIKIWAFKYLAQEEHFKASSLLWNSIEGKNYLSQFLMNLQIQSAYGNKQVELAWALYDQDLNQRFSEDEIGPWLCLQSALRGCQSLKIKSCERIHENISKTPWMASTSVTRSLSYAEMSRCRGQEVKTYIPHLANNVRELYEAVEYAKYNSTDLDEILSWLRRSKKINSLAETILVSHILKNPQLKKYDKDLFTKWVKSSETYSKSLQGYAWIDHWEEHNQFKNVFTVTQKMNGTFNDSKVYKAQLLAGQKLKNFEIEFAARTHLENLNNNSDGLRIPASSKERAR